jgi:hypothetical protein
MRESARDLCAFWSTTSTRTTCHRAPVPGCRRGAEEGCGELAGAEAEESDVEGWFLVRLRWVLVLIHVI